MNSLRNRLFCRLDGLTPQEREQKRNRCLQSLGLLGLESIPVCEEATQIVARFLETPIATLALMLPEQMWLKSAIGLSRVGLMNQLAESRKIARDESLDVYVVDSQQPLTIEDSLADPVFARSILVQEYGIRAYLGTPLLTGEGECIGVLAVMDLIPHQFTDRDLEFLTMTARWCMGEYERNRLLANKTRRDTTTLATASSTQQQEQRKPPYTATSALATESNLTSLPTLNKYIFEIKLQLLGELIQELKTPLTSVVGMAGILEQEIYGALNNKQREYIGVINGSGQHLRSLVEEIVNIDLLDENTSGLQIAPVDVDMLGQQVFSGLEQIAHQHKQKLNLSVEPGNRIWKLDKDRVRQCLYYLVLSVIESAEPGGEVRLHVSRKNRILNLSVWVSHPWLGEGLPHIQSYSNSILNTLAIAPENPLDFADAQMKEIYRGDRVLSFASLAQAWQKTRAENKKFAAKKIREMLTLMLSCHLAELHEGRIIVQGSLESGYRYVLKLPKVASSEESR